MATPSSSSNGGSGVDGVRTGVGSAGGQDGPAMAQPKTNAEKKQSIRDSARDVKKAPAPRSAGPPEERPAKKAKTNKVAASITAAKPVTAEPSTKAKSANDVKPKGTAKDKAEGSESNEAKETKAIGESKETKGAKKVKAASKPKKLNRADGAASSPFTPSPPAKSKAAPCSPSSKDVAIMLGYQPGDKMEVQWEVETSDSKMEKIWWSASLLKWDDKVNDNGIPIHRINYTALPNYGFPEESVEEVIFVSHDVLVAQDQELNYRCTSAAAAAAASNANASGTTAGVEENEIYVFNPDELDEHLNRILMQTISKNFPVWSALTPAKQAEVASLVSKKKEKLKQVLQGRQSLITSKEIPDIIREAFT